MPPILRATAAVIFGLFIGSIANMALIELNTAMYPMPEGTDPNDWDQLAAYIGTLPSAAFITVMIAHLSQALVGGLIAAALVPDRALVVSMIVAGLTSIGGLLMLLWVPSPPWMWLEMPLYAVAGWVAAQPVVWRQERMAA